jgi:hypothetical protein
MALPREHMCVAQALSTARCYASGWNDCLVLLPPNSQPYAPLILFSPIRVQMGPGGMEALITLGSGDMRRTLNILQVCGQLWSLGVGWSRRVLHVGVALQLCAQPASTACIAAMCGCIRQKCCFEGA